MNKILAITEKIPNPSSLPDGVYAGIWGGYVIEVNYKDKYYELKTEEGVRGGGIKVMVTIKGDIMSFEEVNN